MFKNTLLLIFFVELFSFLTQWLNVYWPISNVIFVLISLAILGLAFYRLRYGLLIALLELLIGSQGHYFDFVFNGQTISIRMIIFAIVMCAWLYQSIRNRTFNALLLKLSKNKSLMALIIVGVWGLILALIYGNKLSNIANDLNAWFYFLYLLPTIAVFSESKLRTTLWPIFAAGVTAVSLKSLFFLYVFSHKLQNLQAALYDWGRDTRWGEFTSVSGGLFRIFSQAQVYALIGLLVLFCCLQLDKNFQQNKTNKWFLNIVVALNLAAVLLSLSRSYWVGIIAAAIAFVVLSFVYLKSNLVKFTKVIGQALLVGVLTAITLIIVLFLPIPQQTVLNPSSALNSRFDIQDQAGASRWNQLPHLSKAIAKHPFLGSGWGSTITYESRDPRITSASNPLGRYTTYAFEWGYLDIILKIGIVGLIIYAIFIFQIAHKLILLIKKERSNNALYMGLLLGLVALIATHMFSPYLNHPLGIGYLVILYALLFESDQLNIVPIKS